MAPGRQGEAAQLCKGGGMKLVWNDSPVTPHKDHSLHLPSLPRRIYHGESPRKVCYQPPPPPNSACPSAVPPDAEGRFPLKNPVTPHPLSSSSALSPPTPPPLPTPRQGQLFGGPFCSHWSVSLHTPRLRGWLFVFHSSSAQAPCSR